MASQPVLSTDETFFNGTISNTEMVYETERDDIVNSTVTSLSQGNKTRKSKRSLATAESKTKNPKTSSLNKENAPPKTTGEKKRGRPSTEAKREVLKVLNENSQLKTSDVKPKPSPRRSTRKAEPSPRKANAKESNVSKTPKIIIYEDDSCRVVRNKRKSERQESKSWDGRKTFSEKKTPKFTVLLRSKSVSESMQNLKSPKKELKSPKSKSEKTPSKGRGKLSKTDPELENHLAKLETLFPNVDPEYLKLCLSKLKGSLSKTIDCIIFKEKTNELPTKTDYMKRQETERQQKEYLEKFSIEDFIKLFPDPWDYFLKQEKQRSMDYIERSMHYLKNKFKKHYTQAIQAAMVKGNYSLYRANKELQKKNRQVKMRATNRSKAECDSKRPTTYDEQFMHEVAFIENEAKIKAYIKKTETVKHKKFKQAKEAGTLLECLHCNDPSLLLDDAVNCPANHVFCKDCVVKSVDVEMENNNFRFKCLVKCEEMFSMESLKRVLIPDVIEIIQKRNQMEEVKAAKIKDLVWCPFCCYATIMPPELSVLSCLNPDCLKESCRHCKQLNHIPLKCRELENFEKSILKDQNREKEQESDPTLICIQCNKEFLETDESNKMVCPCGATICSICQQPIPKCPHFMDEPAKHGVLSISSSSDVTDSTNDAKSSPDSKVFDFDENLADFYPPTFHSF